ncbi:AraC family transcriptional regulator [Methylobacterium platani JCM 14648]|uniref:AraC family transcriptional regulator n=2 Tax=Methylobacterium platani TaxID=427683 RepID=A0A179SEM9_9HYPH|nr:AraC family transcriptional regulator [Methylobacterium platani JCM 14648]OAS25420.1 AraC family transcriptional regulator [Methylobacterium platani]
MRGPNLSLEGSSFGPRTIPAWREAVAPFWDVEIRKEDTPDFRGRSEVYHLGNAIIGLTAASGLRNERSRGLIARMGVDHVAAQIRTEGRATIAITGREAPVAPGDVSLLDLAQPLSMRSTGYRAVTVIIPRALFPDRGARLGEAHGTVLCAATPFGTLVGDHLRSLAANVPHFSPAEARAAAQATAILLAAAARMTTGSDAVERPLQRAPVFLAIRSYIDAEIGSADLGVEHLCRRFGVSRSGLYRLFAPLGGVLEYVRRRRLARAYRDLAEGDGRAARVSEIAFRYGYGSPASFTTAFRAEFGLSPVDVKAGARVEGVAASRPAPADPATGDWDGFYEWVLTLDA